MEVIMERFVKVGKLQMFWFCFKLDKKLSALDGRQKMIDKFGAKTLYTKDGKFVYRLVKDDGKHFKYKLKRLRGV